ncbi:CAP domain-containing protein [Cellulomonas sp. S1-8]|uniref:CAP domain-containing protein n=1 Tax=Cellulomonas sp. S1-8 TaxID=2904790 RepID=UPI002243A562|nr:CAP domain-containing protein [Cellulomonas sp. S1-8]UZN04148.1 CAP domain-containing protein [Cellulomonas sp. S1-8]
MTPKSGGVLAVLLVLPLLVTGCDGAPTPEPTTSAPAASATESLDPGAYAVAVVESTNTARVADDLPALQVSACAAQAAADRAADLVGAADLAHAPMDGVIRTCGVSRAAENLSRASAPAQDVVAAWLDSPGHRNNLLDPDLMQIGVACAPDGPDLVCSQVFLGR